MGLEVRNAVTAAGSCGALAPDSAGIGVVRSSPRDKRYWESLSGPLYSPRRPRFRVSRELTLKSSCTKYPKKVDLMCWYGMLSTRELPSIAPNRNVAQPLPLTAVLGEL